MNMNKRIAFYSTPFPNIHSYYDLIDLAADYGSEIIEGFNRWELKTPNPEAAKNLNAYADKKGIRFICLSCYCEMLPQNAPEQIQKMKEYANIAGILGSPWFHHTLVSGYSDPNYVLKNSDILMDTAANTARQIYDYCQEIGLRPIYENHGYLINGVDGFSRFLEKTDRDIDILLDTGNSYSVDETPEQFLKAFRGRIAHVHLKDVCYSSVPVSPRCRYTRNHHYCESVFPGNGIVDLPGILTQLESSGYQGSYSLEFGAQHDNLSAMDDVINLFSSHLDSHNSMQTTL